MSIRLLFMPVVVVGLVTVVVVNLKPKDPPSMNISIPAAGGIAQAQETPAVAVEDTSLPPSTKSRVAIARDAYLDKAIDSVDAQLERMVCARKNTMVAKAREWTRQTGGNTERWLLERLEATTKEAAKNSNAFTGMDGSPEQFTPAKDFSLDTLALLTALQDLYLGAQGESCLIQFGDAFQQVRAFQGEAQTYRAMLEKQQGVITEGANAATSKP